MTDRLRSYLISFSWTPTVRINFRNSRFASWVNREATKCLNLLNLRVYIGYRYIDISWAFPTRVFLTVLILIYSKKTQVWWYFLLMSLPSNPAFGGVWGFRCCPVPLPAVPFGSGALHWSLGLWLVRHLRQKQLHITFLDLACLKVWKIFRVFVQRSCGFARTPKYLGLHIQNYTYTSITYHKSYPTPQTINN